MDTVLLEKCEGYAVVTLNRPKSMNALSRELRGDFVEAFEECRRDEGIRVVILTGRGKAFCAGFDLKELGDSDQSAEGEADNRVARAMEAFPGPIIGAINGHAVTGGFEMALACDVLIASEEARFADTHARVGMLPGWGLSQKLPRLIGLSRAKEISLTGMPVFARQAYEWGLVNHVLPLEELLPRARQIAEAMCACVPEVLAQYKPLIDEGFGMPYREALAWEEQRSIASAERALGAEVSARREAVLEQGRREKVDEG